MKNKLVILLATLAVLLPSFAVATPALAVDIFPGCNKQTGNAAGTDVCNDVNNSSGKTNPIIGTLKVVINLVSLAVGVASVIIIIISGLRMVLDGGDPKAAAQARTGIIYALAGIAVTVMAQAIVLFILDKF
ncbi:MAG TPA: hypothetical protein VLG13_00700 [Patescibacteria group bacterium]|nr:hypothetical protein [Patescibacteria group bacterium]